MSGPREPETRAASPAFPARLRGSTIVFVAGLATIGVTACKQGEGDICQINDDCEDGLICNAATGRCQRQNYR